MTPQRGCGICRGGDPLGINKRKISLAATAERCMHDTYTFGQNRVAFDPIMLAPSLKTAVIGFLAVHVGEFSRAVKRGESGTGGEPLGKVAPCHVTGCQAQLCQAIKRAAAGGALINNQMGIAMMATPFGKVFV